jgi:hypothetical protein
MYFNNASPANLAGPIVDSGVLAINPTGSDTFYWKLLAQITIRDEADARCDSLLVGFNANVITSYVKLCGVGDIAPDTTVANDLELTAIVTTNGDVRLHQCTVEYMPRP